MADDTHSPNQFEEYLKKTNDNIDKLASNMSQFSILMAQLVQQQQKLIEHFQNSAAHVTVSNSPPDVQGREQLFTAKDPLKNYHQSMSPVKIDRSNDDDDILDVNHDSALGGFAIVAVTDTEVTSNHFSVDFSSDSVLEDARIGEMSFETTSCVPNTISDLCLLHICENASVNLPPFCAAHRALSDDWYPIQLFHKAFVCLNPPWKPPDSRTHIKFLKLMSLPTPANYDIEIVINKEDLCIVLKETETMKGVAMEHKRATKWLPNSYFFWVNMFLLLSKDGLVRIKMRKLKFHVNSRIATLIAGGKDDLIRALVCGYSNCKLGPSQENDIDVLKNYTVAEYFGKDGNDTPKKFTVIFDICGSHLWLPSSTSRCFFTISCYVHVKHIISWFRNDKEDGADAGKDSWDYSGNDFAASQKRSVTFSSVNVVKSCLPSVYKINKVILHTCYASGSKKDAQWVTKPPPMPPDVFFINTLLTECTMIMNINRVAFKVVVYPVEVQALNSNGKGLFHEFVADTKVKMIDVEAIEFNTGRGRKAATLATGEGMVQGDMGCLLQDENCPSIAACGALLEIR